MSNSSTQYEAHPRFITDESAHHSSRVEPSESVDASYLTNRIRISVAGKVFWIEPSPIEQSEPLPPELQAIFPCHYITSWNPGGDRFSFEQNQKFHLRMGQSLESLLAKHGQPNAEFRPAVAVARDSQWFEQGWLVRGLLPELVQRFAVNHDQPGTLLINAKHLIYTARGSKDAQVYGWRLVEPERELCPVRLFGAPDEVCSAYGGPWTSRSQRALVLWQEHRRIGLTLLGCGTCAGGTQSVNAWGTQRVIDPTAGIVRLRHVMAASRFGGYCWGPQTNIAIDND